MEPDDEVLVSTLTFIAPANAIRYVGAWPVFIDAEPRYRQMDTAKAIEFLTGACDWRSGGLCNRATGRRVRAVLPVHILGHPVDIEPLIEVARRFGLPVIEDATESLGAQYRGARGRPPRPIGLLQLQRQQAAHDRRRRDDRHRRRAAGRGAPRYLTTQAKDDPIEYVHQEIGYNYRLTNVQAAMGVAQMERLPAFVAAKRRIAAALCRRPGRCSRPGAHGRGGLGGQCLVDVHRPGG